MTPDERATLLEYAIRWHEAGFAVIPARADGTKAPAVDWRAYQAERPTLDQVIAWMSADAYDGFGLIMGKVSGHAEMAELEGRAVDAGALVLVDQWAADNGMETLVEQLLAGYCETTPSRGIHLLYRLADDVARRNTKLAKDTERRVLAETRGEGGFVVVAPSGGRTHPTGQLWAIVAGSPETVPVITGEQRDQLWALLGMLDTQPQPEVETRAQATLPGGASDGTRPGDEFNDKASWDDILTPHGWRKAWAMGRGHAWKRPGKDTPGISATTGQAADGVDRLYVFSTATDFDAETPYTKFAAFALLEHGGDYTAAAKALAAAGFGSAPSQPILPPARPAPVPALSASLPQPMQAPVVAQVMAPPAPPLPPSGATLAQSEDGHAQALIAEHGHAIRYCVERGRWLHWDGWRWEWQPSSGGMVREYAKAVARAYPDDSGWRTHKKRSLSAAGTSACLAQAATDFRVAVSQADLDARPWELNTPGGIVDLRTGQLLPADPAKLHTKLTLHTPDAAADASEWLAFLATTFQGDADLIEWMQRLLGYACIGVVRENILPVFYGATGANGKTVLLDTVMALLGDYAGPAPKGFLLQGPTKHDTEIADLAGLRMLVSSETNSGERFDEGKVKLLTGGDRLKARFMRQDYFHFTPSHTIFLMSNHRPEVTSGGDAFWRRVREVPFDHQMPEELRDPELKDRLVTQHGPAVMAWLAAGAAKYAATGLAEPSRVRTATTEYARDTDTVAQFIDEMCIIGGAGHVRTRAADLRAAYDKFCDEMGSPAVSTKAFGTGLRARYGIESIRSHGVRFYDGISLLATTDGDTWGQQ